MRKKQFLQNIHKSAYSEDKVKVKGLNGFIALLQFTVFFYLLQFFVNAVLSKTVRMSLFFLSFFGKVYLSIKNHVMLANEKTHFIQRVFTIDACGFVLKIVINTLQNLWNPLVKRSAGHVYYARQ